MRHILTAILGVLCVAVPQLRAADTPSPTRIPKPFVTQMACSTLDMYPTILAATGAVATYQIQPLDGISLPPLFERKTESRSRPIPFWSNVRNHSSHAALLDWPYKLHPNPAAGRARRGGNAEATLPAVLLYDISKDPTEINTLTAPEPERVAKMTAALEAWKASVERSFSGADYATAPRKRSRPSTNPVRLRRDTQ